jgi:hypothetical protein
VVFCSIPFGEVLVEFVAEYHASEARTDALRAALGSPSRGAQSILSHGEERGGTPKRRGPICAQSPGAQYIRNEVPTLQPFANCELFSRVRSLKSSIGSTADGGSNLKLPEGEERPNVDVLKGFIQWK